VTYGSLVLLRHAETEWSAAGRHTGRTDVPLTPAGEEHARSAGERLAGYDFAEVRSSPLQRARRTAELAGFVPLIDEDLLEWDYGVYEGRTTADIRADLGDSAWTVWTTSEGLGETVDDVGARAGRAVERVAPTLRDGGDVLLVAHAHLLRILTAAYLGLPPDRGRSFALGPGEIAVLCHERDEPVVTGWGR
jgi:probable phosphoglycerate mutase